MRRTIRHKTRRTTQQNSRRSPGTKGTVQALQRRGFRYLYIVDAASLFALMTIITTVRFGLDWPSYPASHYAVGFAAATVLHMTIYYFGGLYEYEKRLGRPPWLPRAALLTLMAVGADATVALLTGRYLMPRGNLVILAVTASLLITFNRWLTRRVRTRRSGPARVLLVGNTTDVDLAIRHLGDSEPTTVIVGQTENSEAIVHRVSALSATDLLLLSGHPLEAIYPEPLGELESRQVGVYHRITPADTLLGLQRTRQIGGMPFVALRAHALPACRLRFKRLLDLAYLLLLAPLVLPMTAGVGLYVRIRAGRGVLYRQQRVGRAGRPFVMLKFRTMAHDAEPSGPELAKADDPRVLAGMSWLRSSRLDELPQLWNVLTGTMSIVGPRPERPELVAQLEQQLAGYGRRHDIPPGLTGLAQTQGHYQTDPAFKLGHDLQYVVNWSPVLDWEIMVKSLLVMARRSAR